MIRAKIDLENRANTSTLKMILWEVADILIEKMQKQLEMKDAIATGYLYGNFKTVIESPLHGFVRNEAPYSQVLEYGAKPHSPPYDEILEWVRIKKQEEGERAEKAAWRIIKKIEKEGYEGRYYARDALREVASRV